MRSAAKPELLATLRRLPLFSELSEDELSTFAQSVTRRSFGSNAVIFSEGDPCNELWIVESGEVRLLKTAVSGRQQLMNVERPGSSLEEVPVFDVGNHSVTAQTSTASVLLCVEAQTLRNICLKNPEVAAKFIKALGHRLRHLEGLVEQLAFSSVRGRLIAHLLSLAQRGTKTSRGIEFPLTENNEQLATRLGTVRELISRNLGRLHNEGLIVMHRRTVAIPDCQALQQEETHW